jgi:hypothetical protein
LSSCSSKYGTYHDMARKQIPTSIIPSILFLL